MAQQRRTRLKDNFKNGTKPAESDFADLIDSMINALDDGIDKSDKDGLKVSQLMGSGRLMSFYENLSAQEPQWFIELGPNENNHSNLRINTPHADEGHCVLSLRSLKSASRSGGEQKPVGVGINKTHPQCELDVDGTIASSGRIGKRGNKAVLANGKWQDITPSLSGCQAFEIMAGVGGHDSEGRYAMTHAFAMNVFHGHGSIDYRQTYFRSSCERIELRWNRAEGKFNYTLQMRVHCAYDPGVWIQYHLTQLWFDTKMVGSLQEPKP